MEVTEFLRNERFGPAENDNFVFLVWDQSCDLMPKGTIGSR